MEKNCYRFTFIFLIIFFLAFACDMEQKESRLDVFKKINEEVLKNSDAYASLKEATSTIGHRLTGSENGRKAEEYAYNKFRSYGYENVHYDDFEVVAWSRGEITTELNGTVVPSVSLAHSPLEADVTGLLVDMGNGLEADYMLDEDAVTGKIALIYIGLLEGSSEGLINLHRSEKTALAVKYGAIGVIIFNQVDGGVLLTGTASVTGDLLAIPAICIGKEDGMRAKGMLASKDVRAHLTMTNHSNMIKARNVIATIEGTEMPDERIIICGHLDSWDLAEGAIDNGIGSFAVMDIARTFKANNLKPRRTIQFVLFMGEEQGLFGSKYMVEKEKNAGTIDHIKYIMNLDMSGNPKGINASGMIEDKDFFTLIGSDIQKIEPSFANEFTNKSSLHSDHQPFMLEGVPYVDPISDLPQKVYDCYHSNCDTFDLVDENHIRNTVRFMSMLAYGLSVVDVLPAKKMDSKTTKQFMIDNDLRDPLTIAGDWKWGDD